MKKILLIGGGTGGHIIPLKNLAEELSAKKCQVEIVVSDSELDRKISRENFLIDPSPSRKGRRGKSFKIHYFKTDKIRRYLSWRNIFAPFKIVKSIFSAKKLLAEIKPDVVFFKGGFVGFPFLMALVFSNFRGKIYGHESDIEPGKLTKLLEKIADKVFYSFGTPAYPLFYSGKNNSTNSPLAKGARGISKNPAKIPPHPNPLLEGEGVKKKLLIFGGSQGAQYINELVRDNLEKLTKNFAVFLVTGVGKQIIFPSSSDEEKVRGCLTSEKMKNSPLIPLNEGDSSQNPAKFSSSPPEHEVFPFGGWGDLSKNNPIYSPLAKGARGISCQQTEMLTASELREKIVEADLIVSRAGANSLFEIISAKKPSVIIPLPSSAKNHQEKNAEFFAHQGLCYVFHQNKNRDFYKTLMTCWADQELKQNLQKSTIQNSAKKIAEEIIPLLPE